MREYMDDYYTKMKNVIGIDEKIGENEEQPLLEDAIKTLRPNMDPKQFVHMMKTENTIHKVADSKHLVRKTQDKVKEEEQKKMGGFFASAHRLKKVLKQHRNDPSNDIDQILTVMDHVNTEASKKGFGGGLHGQANRIVQGIN